MRTHSTDRIDHIIEWDFGLLDNSKKFESTTSEAESSNQPGSRPNQLTQKQSLDKCTTLRRRPSLDGHYVLNDKASKRARFGPSDDELQTNTNSPIFSSSLPPNQLRPHSYFTKNPVQSSLNAPHLTRVESRNPFYYTTLVPTPLVGKPYNEPFSKMIRVESTHDTLETSPSHSNPFISSSSLPQNQLHTLESNTKHNPTRFHDDNHLTRLELGNPIFRTLASPPKFPPIRAAINFPNPSASHVSIQNIRPFPNPSAKSSQKLKHASLKPNQMHNGRHQSFPVLLKTANSDEPPSTSHTSTKKSWEPSAAKEIKMTHPISQLSNVPCIFPKNIRYSSKQFEYRLINFKPSSIDQEIMIEAINALQILDQSKFFNLDRLHQKLFCLYISTNSKPRDFLQFFELAKYSGAYDQKDRPVQRSLLTDSWKDLFTLDGPHQYAIERFRKYASVVRKPFRAEIDRVTKRINTLTDSKDHYLKYFKRVSDLLGFHLLYVDLISTILPVENSGNPIEALTTQRSEAALLFLEILELSIFDHEKMSQSKSPSLREIWERVKNSKNRRLLVTQSVAQALNWKLLVHWIINLRTDLAPVLAQTYDEDHFKTFFNSLVHCWFKNVSSKNFLGLNLDREL